MATETEYSEQPATVNRRHGISVQGRLVGPGNPVLIVAELSANHHQRYEEAIRLVHAARDAGADAVKLQTYTPDTITLNVRNDLFRRAGAKPEEPQYLYDLYSSACTPWEWHAGLKAEAEGLGLLFFSTPFDPMAVEQLESINIPAYKVASFEIVDIPLLQCIARTGKPVILSTGMATLSEIEEAVQAVRSVGNELIVLLRCSSAYPAHPVDLDLRTIPHMAQTFGVPVGFSDHTLGIASSVAAVALGANIVEKHLTMSRADGGPDAPFSLEPHEFRELVDSIRVVEQAVGQIRYGPTEHELRSLRYRRSLFVVADLRAGECLTASSVRSIRPASGLHPRHLPDVLGRRVQQDIARGTPLSWELFG